MIIAIKHLHMSLAIVSILGFLLRSYWLLRGSHWFSAKLTKFLPHIIDTALLASAITLLVLYGWNPLEQPWLVAKILALFAYVGFGICAFRLARNKVQQLLAIVAAMTSVSYLLGVALTKSPSLLLI